MRVFLPFTLILGTCLALPGSFAGHDLFHGAKPPENLLVARVSLPLVVSPEIENLTDIPSTGKIVSSIEETREPLEKTLVEPLFQEESEPRLGMADGGFYDPFVGRWISRDKVPGDGNSPTTLNRYTYVRNSPLLFIDPDGQFEVLVHTKGVGHIGIAIRSGYGKTSFDFGRFEGQYSKKPGALDPGPNILQKSSGGLESTYYGGYPGAAAIEIQTSDRMEGIIMKKFESKFASGSATMPRSTGTIKSGATLRSGRKYMGTDWGVLGPNYLTFTKSTILEALNEVIASRGNGNKELVAEAIELSRVINQGFGIDPMPKGVKEIFKAVDKKEEKVKIKERKP
jgi:RHS repeat-associated protein